MSGLATGQLSRYPGMGMPDMPQHAGMHCSLVKTVYIDWRTAACFESCLFRFLQYAHPAQGFTEFLGFKPGHYVVMQSQQSDQQGSAAAKTAYKNRLVRGMWHGQHGYVDKALQYNQAAWLRAGKFLLGRGVNVVN